MRISDASKCLLGLMTFLVFLALPLHADITVKTFHDQNNNGIQDQSEPLITGLMVEGFDELGNTHPFLDDGNGTFILPALIPFNRLRVKVTGYGGELRQGVAGPTSVFFAIDGDEIAVPISTGPTVNPLTSRIMIPCYEKGAARQHVDSPGFVSFPYGVDGVAQMFGGTAADPQIDATISQIGSTWGVAYQGEKQRAFTGTVLKRHVGLGPEGPGGVYVLDYSNGGVPQLSSFNLHGMTPSVGPAINLGTVAEQPGLGTDLIRQIVDVEIDETMPYALSTVEDRIRRASYDVSAFDQVAKIAFGDLDMSDDGKTLWLVNLKQRSLISMDVSQENIQVTGANLNHYLIDNLPGLPNLNFLYRRCINAGSNKNTGGAESFTDPNRIPWDKNKFSLGGLGQYLNFNVGNTMNPAASTSIKDLYNTFRKGDFSYNIPIPNEENYEVVIHFAEPNTYVAGDRKFDIMIEGDMVASDFDIVAAAGGSRMATTLKFQVQGTGPTLDVEFISKQGNKVKEALVSGIEIGGESVMKSGVIRPWGLKMKGGKGYLGVVTDASISQSREHLIACVLSFDPENVEAGFTEEVAFSLNYPRERASNAHIVTPQALRSAAWQAWIDDWNEAGIETASEPKNIQGAVLNGYAQPILSDISFTPSGDMVISVMDRWAHQNGHNNYGTNLGDRTLLTAYASGDIIKAFKEGDGSYFVERENNDDGQFWRKDDGPSYAGEFFYEDNFNHPDAHHGELITGGQAILEGTDEVIATVHNPITTNLPAFSLKGIFTQGIHFYSTNTGQKTRAYLFVDQFILGKANGLGDMEFASVVAGAEVGNYVWCDANGNGVQDPTEFGIDGIEVVLIDKDNGNVPVDTVITSGGGSYLFSDLLNNHCYEIRINLDQLTALGYSGGVSPLAGDPDTDIDSDGDDQMVPNHSVAMFCTGSAGEHMHDIDFGFLGPEAEDCTIAECDDGMGMGVPCANFSLDAMRNCVDPSGMNTVTLHPTLNDADSMLNEITGMTMRSCNDSCVYARVMIPGDPMCFSIAKVNLNVIDLTGTGAISYAIAACPGDPIDLNLVLISEGLDFIPMTDTFYTDMAKSNMIVSPTMYVPPSYPNTVYFCATLTAGCVVSGQIDIDSVGRALVNAGDSAVVCGFECIDLTSLGASFNANQSGATDVQWRSSSGAGTFIDDNTFANARLYCPDTVDVANGSVTLYLEVLDDPCGIPVVDSVFILIEPPGARVIPGPRNNVSCKDSFAIDPGAHDDFDGCRIVVNCVDTLVGDVIDYSTIVADCADTTTVGIALNYDGVDDYVIDGNPEYIDVGEVGEFTIEAWIRMENYGAAAPIGSAILGDLRIQGMDNGMLLAVDPIGFVQIYRTGSGFLVSTSQVPLDTWTHLALVQDATGIHLYVNGLFAETLTTAQYLEVADTMVLGAYTRDLATFNDFFDGDMDEVRIWDHAREQGAIACDLSTDLSGTEDGLVAYYDFEVGTPCADNTGLTTLPDVTGNGHDGTLVNFDLTGGLADPCESNWTDGALAPFVKYIVRTFEFRYDKQVFYCMDTIGIRGLNWDLFMCPPERDTVYCNDLYRYLTGLVETGEFDVPDSLIEFLPVDFLKDENGNPSPLETGVPTAGGVPLWPPLPGLCDVQVLYKDWVFEGDCPKTIHRQWFIKNSCLGTFDTCDQWLMIADTSGPHIDFIQFFGEADDVEDFFLGLFDIHKTDDHECYHEFMVPPIAVVDSCSGVKQVKANVNGQTVAMEYNPETGLWESHVKVKVPVTQFGDPGNFFEDFFDGITEQSFFSYEFLDSCHNRSTGLFGDLTDAFLDTIPIIVADGTPPVTICNKGVNVTVTDTTVWVPATTFDEGSWDNCGVGLVLARRSDWATACGVNLCDSLHLVLASEHHDSLWCAVLESDKNINPVEAHYARTIEWLCQDRQLCNYPLLVGWAYDLIKYGTLDCIEHPYPVDEAYLDAILGGAGDGDFEAFLSFILPCIKPLGFEDLIDEDIGSIFELVDSAVFFGAFEDLFKIAFARGNGFFNLFGLGDDDGFGSFLGDIGKQIGGGWSEEVPFCCEDACQEVTVEVLTMDYWCNWSKCWTTVRVEDKTPPKVECELFDVTVTCASYKTYYEHAVNAALEGDFEPLQDALGGYDKVGYDAYGQAPDKSEFTIYELDCDSSLVTKDSLVYDEHFGYVWETFTYYRAEYDTTTRTQYNGQVADNCGLICIEEKPWISIDECGVGFVKRTFKFVGQCTIEGSGHVADTVVRHQTIYITNDCSITKAMFEVPKDTMVFDCGIQYDPDGSGNVSGAADPSLTGQATYTFDNDCRLVGIGYYDQVFRIVGGDGACWKIIRTWCFADWCYIGDEPQAPGWWFDKKYEGKYIQCEQKIILLDSTPPVCTIDEIPDVIEAAGCYYTLNTNVTVTDECGVLSYYWQLIDTKTSTVVTQGDGEFDSEVTDGFSISAADLGLTTYKLKVVVRDDCQNESLCEKTFTVDADQKPTPVCLSSITAELTPMDLDQDGVIDTAMATVWAAEYNSSSIASCGSSTSGLTFLIDDGTGEAELPPLSATKLDLGCEHVGTRIVRMYVLDQRGTWDYCSVMLIVQNNMAGCGGTATSIGDLGGAIVTEVDDPVELVDIKVELPDGQMLMGAEDVSGSYNFQLQTGTEVYVKPSKNTAYINGVSTSDLVAIQKHILGKKQLDSWYKEKAADANSDGKISPVDLIQLRKLILAKIDVLPDNSSWRFYDRLTNAETYHINPMLERMVVDFVGVKIGDVNLDNDPSRKAGRSNRSLVFVADDVKIQAGQSRRVSIKAGDFADVQGYQFTLQVDAAKVLIDGVEPGKVLDLGGEHFNLEQSKAGWLTTSWHDGQGVARNVSAGEVIFDLFITAKEEVHLSDVVTITGKHTVAEAYQSDGLIMDVAIRFDAVGLSSRGFALDQNRPNPFMESTIIGFSVPEATQATISIYDVTGKQVKVLEGFVTKGYHEWTVNDLGSHQSGVLYYMLQTQTHSAVRKMIRTE